MFDFHLIDSFLSDNDKAFIEYMKEMNQLNENQTFKMIINAVDLAESQSDLEAVEDYVSMFDFHLIDSFLSYIQ